MVASTLRLRCARSCFQCPQCSSGLATIASEPPKAEASKSGEERASSAPYFLICAACKWSSREIGWLFDKPSGLAGACIENPAAHTTGQSEKQFSQSEMVQGEYDNLKVSLEKYIAQSGSPPSTTATKDKRLSHQRAPSRHLAQIAASRALVRDVPGLPPLKSASATRKARLRQEEGDKGGAARDGMAPYMAKRSWRDTGMERGLADVDAMRETEGEDIVTLERRWSNAWDPERIAR